MSPCKSMGVVGLSLILIAGGVAMGAEEGPKDAGITPATRERAAVDSVDKNIKTATKVAKSKKEQAPQSEKQAGEIRKAATEEKTGVDSSSAKTAHDGAARKADGKPLDKRTEEALPSGQENDVVQSKAANKPSSAKAEQRTDAKEGTVQSHRAEPAASRSGDGEPKDGVRVARYAVCTSIVDREPQGAAEKFNSETPKLYCFTHIEGAKDTTTIDHKWYRNGSLVGVVSLPVRSAGWRTYSSRALGADAAGTWKVEVLNRTSGDLLQTVTFSVE